MEIKSIKHSVKFKKDQAQALAAVKITVIQINANGSRGCWCGTYNMLHALAYISTLNANGCRFVIVEGSLSMYHTMKELYGDRDMSQVDVNFIDLIKPYQIKLDFTAY